MIFYLKIIYIKAAFLVYSIVVRSDGKKHGGAAGILMISHSLKPIFFILFGLRQVGETF